MIRFNNTDNCYECLDMVIHHTKQFVGSSRRKNYTRSTRKMVEYSLYDFWQMLIFLDLTA